MLALNYSPLLRKPTGISNYALGVLPALAQLQPLLLAEQSYLPQMNWQPLRNLGSDGSLGGRLRRLLWTQRTLPCLLRARGAELLFTPAPEGPLGLTLPQVVMVHDLRPLLQGGWNFQRLYFQGWVPPLLRQARLVLTNSEATARSIQERVRLPEDRLRVIPLGYDRDHFRPGDWPTRPYFLHVGQQYPHKNLERLIRAFARLKLTDLELWLAGAPHPRETPRLQQLVAELGLNERVRWLAYVPYGDLPRLYGEAIALVYPSLWEGFGFPILEAIACGTPVITSDCSSMPEVAGDAALLVPPRSVDALAEAMDTLARDSGLRSDLRQRGLVRARRFSWEVCGQETVAHLCSLPS